MYSVFHRFRQSKFPYGGSILRLSVFLLLPPLKKMLAIKVVKSDSKIINSLPWSKLVKQPVGLRRILVEGTNNITRKTYQEKYDNSTTKTTAHYVNSTVISVLLLLFPRFLSQNVKQKNWQQRKIEVQVDRVGENSLMGVVFQWRHSYVKI